MKSKAPSNSLAETISTPLSKIEQLKTSMSYRLNIYSRVSYNSEASEILENLEETFVHDTLNKT